MRSVFPTRVAKIGYVAASVLLGVLGICLIAASGISAEALGMAYGILLMLSGVFRLGGAAKEYVSFSGIADGTEGHVKFVYRSEGVKSKDE